MSGHPTGLAAVAMSMSDTWDRQFRIPDSICPDFDLAKPVPRVGSCPDFDLPSNRDFQGSSVAPVRI